MIRTFFLLRAKLKLRASIVVVLPCAFLVLAKRNIFLSLCSISYLSFLKEALNALWLSFCILLEEVTRFVMISSIELPFRFMKLMVLISFRLISLLKSLGVFIEESWSLYGRIKVSEDNYYQCNNEEGSDSRHPNDQFPF